MFGAGPQENPPVTYDRLQELVNEKLKTQRRTNELESLAHELEMRALNQDSPSPVDQELPENRSNAPGYLVVQGRK